MTADVHIRISVDVVNLPGSEGAIPIDGAAVTVNYTVIGDVGPTSKLATVIDKGAYINGLDNYEIDLPQNTTPFVTFSIYAHGAYHSVNYEVDDFGLSPAGSAQPFGPYGYTTGTYMIQPYAPNPDWWHVAVHVDAATATNRDAASALVIYSALRIPINYASAIGATLPTQFWANYGTDGFEGYNVNFQKLTCLRREFGTAR